MDYRLYCRRQGPGGDYCVTVRNEKLCLTLPNINDPYQLWQRSGEQHPFMLINTATGMAAKVNNVGDQLSLVPKCSSTNCLWWSESQDLGCGFKSLRPFNNDRWGMDAWDGHIFDGTLVSVYPNTVSNQLGENAQWKFVHVPSPTPTPTPTPAPAPAPAPVPVYNQPSNMIYCLAGDGQYSLAIQQGKIVLTHPNPKDDTQHWYKDESLNNKAGGFMLVNKATFQAAKQSSVDQPLQLVDRAITYDGSLLWAEREIDEYGFRFIVTTNNNNLAMDARNSDHKGGHDDKHLSYSKNLKGDNQKWQFIPQYEIGSLGLTGKQFPLTDILSCLKESAK